ncbi:MAG: hypothetical protein Q8P84_06825 [Deltaproteobacteria bacterium]|nr:hypothetical protein [Deltaproteobacteria bacterium]
MSNKINAQQTPIQLNGPLVRLDGEKPTQRDAIEFDPKTLNTNIDPKGVPITPQGHCKAVYPLINAHSAEQIENPVGRVFVKGTSWVVGKIDRGFDLLFKGIGITDHHVFEKGIDHVTQVNSIENSAVQHSVRWLERAVAAVAAVGGYQYFKMARNPEMASLTRPKLAGEALKKTGSIVKGNWPLGLAVLLTATGLASHASELLDTLDPEKKYLRGTKRDVAEGALYTSFFAGAAALLAWPTKKGYRRVNATTAEWAGKAKPMGWKAGLAFSAFYFAWDIYWTNASAQERILTSPLYNEKPGTGMYAIATPWNFAKWEKDALIVHPSAAHSLAWGTSGYIWAALLGWEFGITNFFTKRMGLGTSETVFQKTAKDLAFIANGTNRVTRGLRSAFSTLYTTKRLGYTAFASMVGLPFGIGVGRAMEMSANYSSKEAVSGTPLRAVITGPLSTAGTAFFTGLNGYSRAWEGYTFNMIPINYTWAACSKMGENVYQVSRKLADDYTASDDPNEKRKLRTLLANLYQISYDSGETEVAENEKLKIGQLLAGVGISTEAIEDAVTRYASPAAE